jgi:hypothetical protein
MAVKFKLARSSHTSLPLLCHFKVTDLFAALLGLVGGGIAGAPYPPGTTAGLSSFQELPSGSNPQIQTSLPGMDFPIRLCPYNISPVSELYLVATLESVGPCAVMILQHGHNLIPSYGW